ncbi:transglutaminase domain-containing protein [bacterium]|nr:transglutaminase domain-containing protein [bacterium]MBR2273561.1 transglutaminase domain-containing protein [Alphaproteobacteria bacterium]
MRRILFIFGCCCVLLYCNNVYATRYTSRSLSRYAASVPRTDENNITSLVTYLTKRLDDDYDKAKVIAFWIAQHINYDEYLYHNGKTTNLIKNYHEQEPRELIRSRVGICGDFSTLFIAMCQKAGIRAYEVHGYAYPGKRFLSANKLRHGNFAHVWNYFLYKNKKVYVDTTFMSQGLTEVKNRITDWSHRRALKDVIKDNRYKSQVNNFDDYYFDFDYKEEMRDKNYVHHEK